MTVNNKADLLVKEDGSTEVLLEGNNQQKARQQRSLKQRRKFQLTAVILLLLLCCGGVVFTVMIVKYQNHNHYLNNKHNLKYKMGGEVRTCGTTFVPEKNAEVIEIDDTISITDGASDMTAVKILGEDGPICIVRNDKDINNLESFVLPSNDVLEKNMFNTTESTEPMPVVMSDKVWEIDYETHIEQPSQLISDICGTDVVYYGMKPAEDEDMSGDFYTNDAVVDDEEFNNKLMERERRGISEESPPEETSDEESELTESDTTQESDHNRNCCNLCTNPHLYCEWICFDAGQHVYTSLFQTCYRRCQVVMPCSWWDLRAFAQV